MFGTTGWKCRLSSDNATRKPSHMPKSFEFTGSYVARPASNGRPGAVRASVGNSCPNWVGGYLNTVLFASSTGRCDGRQEG